VEAFTQGQPPVETFTQGQPLIEGMGCPGRTPNDGRTCADCPAGTVVSGMNCNQLFRGEPDRDNTTEKKNTINNPFTLHDTCPVQPSLTAPQVNNFGDDNTGVFSSYISNFNGDQMTSELSDSLTSAAKTGVYVINKGLYYGTYPFIYTQATIQNFSNMLCDTFSSVGFYQTIEPSCNDRYYVYYGIQIVIWFFICIWIFFNWYYILCYRENEIPTKTYDISWIWLKKHHPILSLIFKYVVCQVSFINAVLMFYQRYANFVGGPIWGPKLNYIFLFLFIFILVEFLGITTSVVDLLIKSITMHLGMVTAGIFIFMALIFAVYTFMIDDMVVTMAKFLSVIGMLLTFLLFVIRFIWSVIIIFVAGFFIAVYMIAYSLFGMFIYSPYTIKDTINKILDYIAVGFEDVSPFKYSVCRPRTWWEWLVETLKWLVKIFIKYMFDFVLIGLLLMNLYFYIIYLVDNPNLQNAMITLSIFALIGAFGYVYRKAFPVPIVSPPENIRSVEKALGVFRATEDSEAQTRPLFNGYEKILPKMQNMFGKKGK
jgi:hypothetical protein